MDLIRLGRRYRRFRHENRYNTPLLIFITDSAISLVKLSVVIAVLAIGWVFGTKYLNSDSLPQAAATPVATTELTTLAATVGLTNTRTAASQDGFAQTTNTKDESDTQERTTTEIQISKPKIANEDWILGLNSSFFIIQFGSGIDTTLFEEFVPVIYNGGPISIYPYKRTPSGRTVYGIATGVFKNSDDALAAVEFLSPEARAYKPWIRQVSELAVQIKSM